jgi:hypothetical protein
MSGNESKGIGNFLVFPKKFNLHLRKYGFGSALPSFA